MKLKVYFLIKSEFGRFILGFWSKLCAFLIALRLLLKSLVNSFSYFPNKSGSQPLTGC